MTDHTAQTRQARTVGLSMFPALLPGDRLEVRPVEGLSSGDIIGFIDAGGALTAHRVLGYCPATDRYLTAGDGPGRTDVPVAADAVVGKVMVVWRQVLGRRVRLPGLLWRHKLLPSALARRAGPRLARLASRLGLRSVVNPQK